MWIVEVALKRPYTFIVLALLLPLLGALTLFGTPLRAGMPVDIFPDIAIPIIAVNFNYTGMSPDDISGRITRAVGTLRHHHRQRHRACRVRRATPASRSSSCSSSRG